MALDIVGVIFSFSVEKNNSFARCTIVWMQSKGNKISRHKAIRILTRVAKFRIIIMYFQSIFSFTDYHVTLLLYLSRVSNSFPKICRENDWERLPHNLGPPTSLSTCIVVSCDLHRGALLFPGAMRASKTCCYDYESR